MSTKKGLKPFTSETGAEAGRKGGIASGESRRRKKTIRQALEALLSCRNPNNGLEGVEEMALAIFEKAKEGDVRAFAEGADQADDITLLLLRYYGQENGPAASAAGNRG